MTRIPTESGIEVRAGGVSPTGFPSVPQFGLPGGSIGRSINIGGQAIAAALINIGRSKIAATHARTLTTVETSIMQASEAAQVEAEKVDPNVAGDAFIKSSQFFGVDAAVKAIRSQVTRAAAEQLVERHKTRGMIAVERAAVGKMITLGRASMDALKAESALQARTGVKTPAELIGPLEDQMMGHVGSSYSLEGAQNWLIQARRFIYDNYIGFLLEGDEASGKIPTPDQVAGVLASKEAKAVFTPAEARQLDRLADRAMIEANGELLSLGLAGEKQGLDATLAAVALTHESFAKTAREAADRIMAQRGFKDKKVNNKFLTRNDVLRFLLSDALEQYARAGDVHRFNAVMDAMGDRVSRVDTEGMSPHDLGDLERNPDAFEIQRDSATGAMVERWRTTLREQMAARSREQAVESNVAGALSGRYRLDNNKGNQAEIDRQYAEILTGLQQSDPTMQATELNKRLVDYFGVTSLLPSQMVTRHVATMQDPARHAAAEVEEAMQTMTYTRNTFPAAYEQYPRDIKDIHGLAESLATPGSKTADIVLRAEELMNPSDPQQAAGIDQIATTVIKRALGSLTEFIRNDDAFGGLDIAGSIEVTRLGNTEVALPSFDLTQIDERLPAGLPRVYLNNVIAFRKAGFNPDAAEHKAWGMIKDGGWGISGALRDKNNPRIVQASPEVMYQNETNSLNEDLWNQIGLDHADLIFPDIEGEVGFPVFDLFGKSDPPLPTFMPPAATAPFDRSTPNITSITDLYRSEVADELDRGFFGAFKARPPRDESGVVGPFRKKPLPKEADLRAGAIDEFETSGFMVLRDDHLRMVGRFATKRLEMRVIGNEDGGVNFRRPDGSLGPAYFIFYVDDDGDPHQVFRNVQRGAETFVEPYILVPDVTSGLNHWRKKIATSIELQKTIREEAASRKHMQDLLFGRGVGGP